MLKATTKKPIQPEGAIPIVPPSHEDNQAIGPCHLFDTKEVALFLNVKESTIRNWVHIGYIPHVKFRGAVRYQKDAIAKWVETCAVSKNLPDGRKLSRTILRDHNRRF